MQDDNAYLHSTTSLENGLSVKIWYEQESNTIQGRIYYTAANTTYQNFSFDIFSSSIQDHLIATNLKNGQFIIVWVSPFQDLSEFGILAQLYEINSQNLYKPVDMEFMVNTMALTDIPSNLIVTNLVNKNFIVIWDAPTQDSTGFIILAQRYEINSHVIHKIDSEFMVNGKILSNAPSNLIIGNLTNKNLIIIWSSPFDGYSAQEYDQDFLRIGTDVLYTTTSHQLSALLAATNKLITFWESFTQDHVAPVQILPEDGLSIYGYQPFLDDKCEMPKIGECVATDQLN